MNLQRIEASASSLVFQFKHDAFSSFVHAGITKASDLDLDGVRGWWVGVGYHDV